MRGGLKMFLVVGHILVEIFLIVHCFFASLHTKNGIFSEGHTIFCYLIAAFSFLFL